MRDCKHGHLARSCELCAYERSVAEYRYAIEEALHVLNIGRDVDLSLAKTWLKNALAEVIELPNAAVSGAAEPRTLDGMVGNSVGGQ